VRIFIYAGTLASRVANWVPKFDGILFLSLGTNTRPYGSAFIVTWGRLKIGFLFQL
jgi:hypothetical protein